MKTTEITIADAFAWSEQVLLANLKKDKGDYIVLDADIAMTLKDPKTKYYDMALHAAFNEYLVEKKCRIDNAFKVVVIVKTKDGADHPYSIIIKQVHFDINGLYAINKELIQPTVVKLVRLASSENPFSDVKSVTCYIEEVENKE